MAKRPSICSNISKSKKMKNEPKQKLKNIYFDIESTGFQGMPMYSKRHQIIQLACVDDYGNTFDELIKVDTPLHQKSTDIHHFTDDDLNEKGKDVKHVVEKFYDFIFADADDNNNDDYDYEINPVLIAHNCYGFDMVMLLHTINQVNDLNLKYNNEKIFFFDTLKYMREKHPEVMVESEFKTTPYNLENLHKYCFNGNGFEGAHNAFADVNAMIKIIKHFNIDINDTNVVKFDLTNFKETIHGHINVMIDMKGIKRWRANIFSEETNKIDFFYRRNWETVTLKDVRNILFKDKSMEDIELFLRTKIFLSDDNELFDILFAICEDKDIFSLIEGFPFHKNHFYNLNLSDDDRKFLVKKKIYTMNELISESLFDNEISTFLNEICTINYYNEKELYKHKKWILDRNSKKKIKN